MGKFKPGTLNDDAVLARRDRQTKQTIRQLAAPTGSQVYGTTSKVKGLESDIRKIGELAASAEASASLAMDAAESAIKAVGSVIGSLEGYALPLHSVVFMASKTNPSDEGYQGEWRFLTRMQIPLTHIALFAYERIE